MSVSSGFAASSAVLNHFRSRVEDLQSQISGWRRREFRTRWVAVAGAIAGGWLLFATRSERPIILASAIVALMASGLALRGFLQARAKAIELGRRVVHCEGGIDRLEENWRGKGRTGTDYARANHAYQDGLNILGEGSLFELLATARSEVGAERLAEFFLDPAALEEARARQEAVKELEAGWGLREEVALLGKYHFQNCEGKHLRDWLRLPVLHVPRAVPALLAVSSVLCLIFGVCGPALHLSLVRIAILLVPCLGIQGLISVWLIGSVRVRLRHLLTLGGDVAILSHGVDLLECQAFQSAKLRGLVDRLRDRRASASIRSLARLIFVVERREDVILFAFSLWLAAGTQLVLATERWRAVHQKSFEGWLDAWAEFEALSALAGYAYEHPEDEFPILAEGGAFVSAKALRHPLLPRRGCVGNDVELNHSSAFYMISGSNMAGKSTFLRAVGLNAVLAGAGAPIAGTDARMTVFNIFASIAVSDSLGEGKSKFLAEVERLRASILAVGASLPVLFLIDEILSGTNSRDRRIAAEAVITALIAGGAIGVVSTHDLALTEIAENRALRGLNLHMQGEDPLDPLAFDYRLKAGILREANALGILKMMGML